MEPQLPTLEEGQKWEYEKKEREIQIARMRAALVRKQITDAYEVLETIRFDFLGDTAFRDQITTAKKGCERAIADYLLDDSYWKSALEKHRAKSPQEYVGETQERKSCRCTEVIQYDHSGWCKHEPPPQTQRTTTTNDRK